MLTRETEFVASQDKVDRFNAKDAATATVESKPTPPKKKAKASSKPSKSSVSDDD